MQNRDSFIDLVKKSAIDAGIGWQLVDAIIQTESSYNCWATRYEPAIFAGKDPTQWVKDYAADLHTSNVAETELQRFSYGLMQILGTRARTLGFQPNLMILLNPEINLHYGCKYLSTLVKKYGPADLDSAIAAYNSGTPFKNADGTFKNQKYVDTVRKFMANT